MIKGDWEEEYIGRKWRRQYIGWRAIVTAPVEKSVVQTDFVGIFDGIDDSTSHTEGGMVGIRTRVVEERQRREA